MTIQEVLLSGKPFRRKKWTANKFLMVDEQGNVVWGEGGGPYFPAKTSLLATDWEIQE